MAGPDGADCRFGNRLNHSIGRITTSGAVTLYPIPLRVSAAEPSRSDPSQWDPTVRSGSPSRAEEVSNTSCTASVYIVRITTSDAVSLFTNPNIVPGDLTVGPDGALWFGNGGCNGVPYSIGRMTTSGAFTTYTGPGLDHPGGFTVGSDGALWFVNEGHLDLTTNLYVDQSIGRITTSGVVSDYSDPSIDGPTGLVAGPDGALWFTNYGQWDNTAFPPVVVGSSIGRITTSGSISSYKDPTVYGPGNLRWVRTERCGSPTGPVG